MRGLGFHHLVSSSGAFAWCSGRTPLHSATTENTSQPVQTQVWPFSRWVSGKDGKLSEETCLPTSRSRVKQARTAWCPGGHSATTICSFLQQKPAFSPRSPRLSPRTCVGCWKAQAARSLSTQPWLASKAAGLHAESGLVEKRSF